MRMTDMQKADYKLYRRECRMSGVEPTLKDFLAFDIPECVLAQLGWNLAEIEVAPPGYFDSEEHLKFELAYEKAYFSGQTIDPMPVAWDKWRATHGAAA